MKEITLAPWFSGLRFKQLKLPCIYAWKRGNRYLYIGKSVKGIRRLLDKQHEVIDVEEPMQPNDVIEIYLQATGENLAELEKAFIRKHKPAYNYQFAGHDSSGIDTNISRLLIDRPLGTSYSDHFSKHRRLGRQPT
jgi:hypothetical protein